MAKVFPFRALRPTSDRAGEVASVPYDVVDRAEAAKLAEGKPASFLHVTRPEIDLPAEVDSHGDEVYQTGRKALDRLIAEEILVRDEEPCFYAYELTMGDHVQTGVVLLASVEDYNANLVRKHEYTRPDKEDDRVHHMEVLEAQSGTVFLCHRDDPGIARVLNDARKRQPAADLAAADGVRHRLWVIDSEAELTTIQADFDAMGPIYIADGHHRSAAASRVAAKNPSSELHRGFLAVSFPTSEMKILPYNRHVHDLQGRNASEFITAVAKIMDVTPGKPSASARGSFGMFIDDEWHSLKVRSESFDDGDPVARLDVSILQAQVLAPLLGIDDPRRSERISFVGGIRGDHELEARVKSGGGVAFSMHPTSIEDLLAIADAEKVMPPKSTWFEPKLRDGLFVHLLRD